MPVGQVLGFCLASGLVMAAQAGLADEVVVSAWGRIEGASGVVPVGLAANGIVANIQVREGDRVVKGQVLVQIECDSIQAELRQKQAELTGTEVGLAKTKAGARDEETAIAMAVVAVSEAKAEEAEGTYQRLSSLKEGTASRARLRESERDAKMTAAQLMEARTRLRMLQAGARSEDVLEAEAKRAAALAAADQVQVRLDQCIVRAPVDGVVLTTNVWPGQLVGSSASVSTLLNMADDSKMRVRAEVNERDARKLCVGQFAKIIEQAGASLRTARVTKIGPAMMAPTIVVQDKGEIRPILLDLDGIETSWPMGLRVQVHLQPCAGAP